MRRAATLASALALLWCAPCDSSVLLSMQQGAYDTDAVAYFNALSGASCAAPSLAFKAAVSAYIKAERTAGNWGNQDAEYIHATTDACTSSVNLAQPSLYKLTFSGSCTQTVQNGLNGDGSSCVGNIGVTQSALIRWTQNNGHIEIWQAANRQFGIGLAGSASTRINNLTNKATEMNSVTTITDTGGGTTGLHFADRTSSSTINTGLNGVLQTTGGSATSAALAAQNITICELNGSFCNSSTNILFTGFGQAMNSESTHYTNVRNLLLALGVTGI